MEIKQVKETCLYVKDLKQIQNFYQKILGLPVIGARKGRHVFFRAGTSVLLCFNPETTKKEDTLPPHFGYGPMHLAFEVSLDEYQDWKDKLIAAGIEIIHEQVWRDKYFSFYFHDPAGNLVEIVQEGMWD